jgi:hypothetical protein
MRGSTEKAAGTWHPKVFLYPRIIKSGFGCGVNAGNDDTLKRRPIGSAPIGTRLGGPVGSIGHVLDLLACGVDRVDDASLADVSSNLPSDAFGAI